MILLHRERKDIRKRQLLLARLGRSILNSNREVAVRPLNGSAGTKRG
jgi:hypothetical protein